MTLIHQQNKSAVKVFCKSLYNFDGKAVQSILHEMLARDAVCHLCHPFGDVAADQIYDKLFAPLNHAMPDLERRDIICLSGTDQDGAELGWLRRTLCWPIHDAFSEHPANRTYSLCPVS